MNISISGHYTVPGYHFDISTSLLKLLADELSQTFPSGAYKGELEIYICTDGKSDEGRAEKKTQSLRSAYQTFYFWFPYAKTVLRKEGQDKQISLTAFVKEFYALLPHCSAFLEMQPLALESSKKRVLDAVEKAAAQYAYQPTAKTLAWREGAAKLGEAFRQGREGGAY